MARDQGSDDDCIFCSIVRGRATVSVVYDEESVLAFLDIAPQSPGHTLVIPKLHAQWVAEVPAAVSARLLTAGIQIGEALRQLLRCPGVNFYIADGAEAGQDVFHTHLHVIPRYADDGLGYRERSMPDRPPRDELDRMASHLGTTLAGPSVGQSSAIS